MRVVGRAVEWVEDPAVAARRRLLAPEFLGHHLVIRKAPGDQRPEHALDLDVHVGDEVDLAFLADGEIGAEVGHLDVARADDGFNGGRKEQGVDHERVRIRTRVRGCCPGQTLA